MSKFCSDCGKEGCKIHLNGGRVILQNEIKHQTQVGEIQHQHIGHRIETLEKDLKVQTKNSAEKFKLVLIVMALVMAPIGSYSVSGDLSLDGKFQKQFENIIKTTDKDIDKLETNILLLESQVTLLREKIASLEAQN